MRGGLLPRLRGILLALAAVGCFLAALGQWSRLEALPAGEQIAWQGTEDGLDRDACRQILESRSEGEACCALWREKKGQTLENPALSRSAEVTVWSVRGSVEVLFTDFVKLSEEDADGCYVDRSVAEELFGDADARGMEVVWGKRRLVIRGILEEGWPLVLVRPSAEETADRIAIGSGGPGEDAADFLVRHAVSGAVYDASCLSGILKLLLLFFPTALCCGLLGEIVPRLRGPLFPASGAIIFCLLAVVLVGIPVNMIPDRWSNFQFWTAWWREYRENLRIFLEYANSGRDTLRILYFVRGAILALLPVWLWSAAYRGR